MPFPLLKISLRRIAIPLLAWLKVPWLLRMIRKCFPSGKLYVAILLYHRIVDPSKRTFHFQSETLGVAPARFADHIAYLARHYQVVPLDAAVDDLCRSGKSGERVVITFDDGYLDNFTEGAPILERYNAPATIFLATNFISGKSRFMWNDRLAPLLEEADLTLMKSDEYDLPMATLLDRFLAYRTLDPGQKKREINSLAEELKRMPNSRKESLLEMLSSCCPEVEPKRKRPDRIMLTWEEVREMKSKNIAFGAHTCSHPILTQVPIGQANEEIIESGRAVARELGLVSCSCFAFPNGRPADIPEESPGILKTAGYRSACTTTEQINQGGVDPFNLKRICIANLSADEFSLFIEYWFTKSWLGFP